MTLHIGSYPKGSNRISRDWQSLSLSGPTTPRDRYNPMHQSAYTPAMALLEMATFAGIGLIAGLIGGLLGIGGSTVFIPAR